MALLKIIASQAVAVMKRRLLALPSDKGSPKGFS